MSEQSSPPLPSPVSPAPPRHVVVLAHPDPHSFNAAVVGTYCETVRSCGQEAIVRDLYAMGFDPVLRNEERPREQGVTLSDDVRAELATIQGADIYTLVYPVWFGMPPAMMKGYIDRVFGAAVTPRAIQDHVADGVLSGRHMLSVTSSGAREVWLDEQGQIESLRNLSTRYLLHAFRMTSCEHLHLGGIVEGFAKRFVEEKLLEVHERTRKVCAMLASARRIASAPLSVADGS